MSGLGVTLVAHTHLKGSVWSTSQQFKSMGFKDKSSIVRLVLDKLHQEIEQQQLEQSAQLYAELYAQNEELTDAAIADWPV